MKIGEIVKRSSEHFKLDGLKIEDLSPIRDRLKEIGYNEKAVFKRLQVGDIDRFVVKYLPVYTQICLKENSLLDLAIKLFLLPCKLTRTQVNELFDKTIIETLINAGLLKEDKDGVFAPVNLFPCMGGFFATDSFFSEIYLSRHVYPLGRDSYCLARGMITDTVDCSLDLCSGSGVQAILASRFSKKVIGIDLNPRSINFARFNALLNGVSNVEFLKGDLYEPVKGMIFDRIYANPPFVPSPEKRVWFRDGSNTGEYILKKIAAGLPKYLKSNGISQIVTLLVFNKGSYNEKAAQWLSNEPFHILTLAYRYKEVLSYISYHIDFSADFQDYSKKLLHWVESYRKAGIEKLADGLINLKRALSEKPIKKLIDCKKPEKKFSKEIKNILENMENSTRSDFINTLRMKNLSINPCVDFFWNGTEADGKRNYGVLFKKDALLIDAKISPFEKFILDKIISGVRSLEKIEEEFCEKFKKREKI